MREEVFKSSYRGTKSFTQHSVRTLDATGFGAAADDYSEQGIDLNEQLIINKLATFFVLMNSDAMEGAGIFCGDILIVDRSIEIAPDKIILAIVNNELLIRFLKIAGGKRYFQAADTKFSTIQLTEASKIRFVGVVTCVLHLFETNLCPLFGEKVK